MDQRLFDLLRSVLGEYKELNSGEYAFKSPFKRHRKKKLQIQLDPNSEKFGYWNDWITDNSGKSLFSLFKRLDVSQEKFKRLSKLCDRPDYNYQEGDEDGEEKERLSLPDDFTPLWKERKTPEYRHACQHLKNRGLKQSDIIKYQIGYCESGEYKNRIIIPSYNSEGELEYFVGRTFFDSFLKYKNPSHPKKEVIGFENLISWSYPVVITEGAFDAIAVKRNAIPLFGSQLHGNLIHELVDKKPPEIIVALDSDAIDKSLEIVEKLLDYDLNISLAIFPEGTDPSDLGFEESWSYIKERDVMNFETLVRFKLLKS